MINLRSLGVFKTLIQCFAGCLVSAALVAFSRASIHINVGGAFGLEDGTGKTRSSFGVAQQIPDAKCTMKVVNPFEIIPETLPGNYLCSWEEGANLVDALCFEPFECAPLHQLWVMYLVTGCVYLVSYFAYGLVWVAVKMRRVRAHARMLYGIIIIVMLSNFVFNKVLDKYLMGVFMDDFSEKIRSIVSNNGYPGFRFRGSPVYELQGEKRISQSLFDICSGMILGMVFAAVESIREKPRSIEE